MTQQLSWCKRPFRLPSLASVTSGNGNFSLENLLQLDLVISTACSSKSVTQKLLIFDFLTSGFAVLCGKTLLSPYTGESEGETVEVPRCKLRHFDTSGSWLDNRWQFCGKSVWDIYFRSMLSVGVENLTQKQMLAWQGPTCMKWKCQPRWTLNKHTNIQWK